MRQILSLLALLLTASSLAAAGVRISPEREVSAAAIFTPVEAGSARIASSGRVSIVTWNRGGDAFVTVLDSDGKAIARSIPVGTAAGQDTVLAIESDGENFLLVVAAPERLTARVLDPSGRIIAEHELPAELREFAQLCWNGEQYLLVAQTTAEIETALLTPEGIAAEVKTIPFAGGNPGQLALASNGADWLIIADRFENVPFVDVIRIDRNGDATTRETLIRGDGQIFHGSDWITWNGRNYVVVITTHVAGEETVGLYELDTWGALVRSFDLQMYGWELRALASRQSDGAIAVTRFTTTGAEARLFSAALDPLTAWVSLSDTSNALDLAATNAGWLALVTGNGVSRELRAVLLDDSIVVRSSEIVATGVRHQLHPAVATGPAGELVTWSEHDEATRESFIAARLLSDQPATQQITIANRPLYSVLQPKVAFGADRFLVVWSQNTPGDEALVGRFVSVDGAAMGETFTISRGLDLHPSISFTGDGFAVLWERSTISNPFQRMAQLHAVKVSTTGTIGTDVLLTPDQTIGYFDPQVAWNGEVLLVAYTKGRPCYAHCWPTNTALDAYSIAIDRDLLPVTSETPLGDISYDEAEVAVASTGGEFLAVFRRNVSSVDFVPEIHAIRLNRAGNPIAGSARRILTGARFPRLTIDGRGYVVVGEIQRPYDGDLLGLRLDRYGDIDGESFVVSATPQYESAVALASREGGAFVAYVRPAPEHGYASAGRIFYRTIETVQRLRSVRR